MNRIELMNEWNEVVDKLNRAIVRGNMDRASELRKRYLELTEMLQKENK